MKCMEGQAPRPKRSRKEEYRQKVRAERSQLPAEFIGVLRGGVPMFVLFGGGGLLLWRQGHHVGGALVMLAGVVALVYVLKLYAREASRMSGMAKRRRETRARRRDARARRP